MRQWWANRRVSIGTRLLGVVLLLSCIVGAFAINVTTQQRSARRAAVSELRAIEAVRCVRAILELTPGAAATNRTTEKVQKISTRTQALLTDLQTLTDSGDEIKDRATARALRNFISATTPLLDGSFALNSERLQLKIFLAGHALVETISTRSFFGRTELSGESMIPQLVVNNLPKEFESLLALQAELMKANRTDLTQEQATRTAIELENRVYAYKFAVAQTNDLTANRTLQYFVSDGTILNIKTFRSNARGIQKTIHQLEAFAKSYPESRWQIPILEKELQLRTGETMRSWDLALESLVGEYTILVDRHLAKERFTLLSLLVFVIPAVLYCGKVVRSAEDALKPVLERLQFLQKKDLGALDAAIDRLALGQYDNIIHCETAHLPPLDESRNDEFGTLAGAINRLVYQTARTIDSFCDAQLSILSAEQEIAASQQQFQTVVESLGEGIVITDLEDRVIYANRRANEILGYQEGGITGLLAWESLMVETEWEAARQRNTQRLAGVAQRYETEMKQQDGSLVWVEVHATPFQDAHGNITGMLGAITDISERKLFEEQLAFKTFNDPLTGLANRALFMERLTHAVHRASRTKETLGVMVVDIDNFKVVNDSLGHFAGDALIQEVASRLARCVRETETLARVGGDEFTILFESLAGEAAALAVADRIHDALAAPIEIDGNNVLVTASMGLTLNGTSETASSELLKQADIALHQAKLNGKRRCAVFKETMQEQAKERLTLESELRLAIPGNQFRVFYQPIVELSTYRVVEMEALIRWQHPTRGLVSPLKFIPVAEETGLINEIGEWVLNQACLHLTDLISRTGDSNLRVGVNVSLPQLRDESFVDKVGSALIRSGLPAPCLKLEITESMMMLEPEHVIRVLEQLRDLGVKLAIDDFGTGYSSMSYLRSLPVHTLKIDRSFVSRVGSGPEDEAILKAIVNVAKTLKLSVTCEGIETNEQWSFLHNLGADMGQGYLIAKPLAQSEVYDWVHQNLEFWNSHQAAA